jgi:hypothetical protein
MRDKIFATIWLAMLCATVIITTGHRAAPYHPRSCAFDGGGVIVSGDAGRTSDGHIWACADGQLYRIA